MSIAIYGATSGIARRVAAVLAKRGDELTLIARDAGEVERIASDLRIRFGTSIKSEGWTLSDSSMLIVAAGYLGPDLEMTERGNYLDLLPIVDAYKGKRIVILSSVAADRLRKSNYAYGLAKQKLEQHVRDWPNVTIIKLGPVDTEMTWDLSKPTVPAEVAAQGIVDAIDSNARIAYVPKIWRPIMMVIKRLPQRIVDKL